MRFLGLLGCALLGILSICGGTLIDHYRFPLTVAGWIFGGLLLLSLPFWFRKPRWLAVVAGTAGFWASAVFYALFLTTLVNAGSGQDAVVLFGFGVGMVAALIGLLNLVLGLALSQGRQSTP
jgi:hypothetical protein